MVPYKSSVTEIKHMWCLITEGCENVVSSLHWSVWMPSFREFPGIRGFGMMKWPSWVMKCLQIGRPAQRAPRSPRFKTLSCRYSLLLKQVGAIHSGKPIATHWSRWLDWPNIWLCIRDWLISFSNRWGTLAPSHRARWRKQQFHRHPSAVLKKLG